MKNLKFALLFLCGFMVFSCTETAEEMDPKSVNDSTLDRPLFQQNNGSEEELIEIGFIQDGEFQFTVSEDKLSEVYTYNVETNLDQSGQLEEANVVPSDNEDETDHFLVMSGSIAEEGSAVISAEVITAEDDAEGLVRVFIRPRPVWAGICYYINCTQCRQSDLTATVRTCRCNSNFNYTCPYVPDPTVVWTQ